MLRNHYERVNSTSHPIIDLICVRIAFYCVVFTNNACLMQSVNNYSALRVVFFSYDCGFLHYLWKSIMSPSRSKLVALLNSIESPVWIQCRLSTQASSRMICRPHWPNDRSDTVIIFWTTWNIQIWRGLAQFCRGAIVGRIITIVTCMSF